MKRMMIIMKGEYLKDIMTFLLKKLWIVFKKNFNNKKKKLLLLFPFKRGAKPERFLNLNHLNKNKIMASLASSLQIVIYLNTNSFRFAFS